MRLSVFTGRAVVSTYWPCGCRYLLAVRLSVLTGRAVVSTYWPCGFQYLLAVRLSVLIPCAAHLEGLYSISSRCANATPLAVKSRACVHSHWNVLTFSLKLIFTEIHWRIKAKLRHYFSFIIFFLHHSPDCNYYYFSFLKYFFTSLTGL